MELALRLAASAAIVFVAAAAKNATVTPKPHNVSSAGAAPSVALVDAMARAVDLVERGTENILANQTAEGAMRHIVRDLKHLRGLTTNLRGGFESDIAALKSDVEKKNSDLMLAEKRAASLEKEDERLQARLENAERDFSRQGAMLNASRSAVVMQRQLFENVREALQNDLRGMRSRISREEVDRQSYESTLARARAEERASEEKRNDALEVLHDFQAANDRLKKEEAASRQETDSLKRDLKDANSDKAQLLASVRMLMRENNAYQAKLEGRPDAEAAFAASAASASLRGWTVPAGEAGGPPRRRGRLRRRLRRLRLPGGLGRADVPPAAGAAVAAAHHPLQQPVAAHANRRVKTGRREKPFDAVAWMGTMSTINNYIQKFSQG